MTERRSFTLVEVLVVVGIIAILASLVLPAVNSAQQQGRITQAKSDMAAIKMALKGVENEYGKMVTKKNGKYTFQGKEADTVKGKKKGSSSNVDAGIGLGNDDGDDKAYDAFIAELTVPGGEGVDYDELNINTRKITFLDPQSGFDPTSDYDSEANTPKLWRDPWGSQYRILIRTESGTYLADPGNGKRGRIGGGDDKFLADSVAIYSFGPNKKDNYGKNAERGDDKTFDDIISWE